MINMVFTFVKDKKEVKKSDRDQYALQNVITENSLLVLTLLPERMGKQTESTQLRGAGCFLTSLPEWVLGDHCSRPSSLVKDFENVL